jgi:hypothetical protein
MDHVVNEVIALYEHNHIAQDMDIVPNLNNTVLMVARTIAQNQVTQSIK